MISSASLTQKSNVEGILPSPIQAGSLNAFMHSCYPLCFHHMQDVLCILDTDSLFLFSLLCTKLGSALLSRLCSYSDQQQIIFSLCLYLWRPLIPSRVCIKASAVILLGVFATPESFLLYQKNLRKVDEADQSPFMLALAKVPSH